MLIRRINFEFAIKLVGLEILHYGQTEVKKC